MSLESKIDDLIKAVNEQTQAVNAFNGNIEKWLSTPTEQAAQEKASEPTPESANETQQSEQSKTEQSAALTHKDVQDDVLKFVRKDVKGNKPKVKTLLGEFGAKKVGDVAEGKLADFHAKLGAL